MSSDMKSAPQGSNLKSQIINRITSSSDEVWTTGDFVGLGNRSTIDKRYSAWSTRANCVALTVPFMTCHAKMR